MRKSIGTAFAAVLVLGLAGCGGGGGGGGGAGIPFLPVAPAPAPVAELKLVIEVGGASALPDSDSGNYSTVPGRQVVVRASDNVTWSGNSDGNQITRTDVEAPPTLLNTRFANSSKTTAGNYTLVARTSDGRTKQVTFAVKTGDYRNGDYTVFAANGSRQKLSINFDQSIFALDGAVVTGIGGGITPPASPGDAWAFTGGVVTVPGAATFRPLVDTVVGGFPFAVPFSDPVTRTDFAFVAARALVTTQASLDGTYNRFRIDATASGRESTIGQIQVSGGGTVMKQCTGIKVLRISDCPAAQLVTSTVSAGSESGMWNLKNSDGIVFGAFAIARIDGDNVYLSAGTSGTLPTTQQLAIGVPEAPSYPAFLSDGWSTKGTLDTSTVTPSDYKLVSGASTTNLVLSTVAPDAPTGMRFGTDGTDGYFAMRSNRLEVLVGARGKAPTQGYLHLGVVR
jgi:hypothetical protein